MSLYRKLVLFIIMGCFYTTSYAVKDIAVMGIVKDKVILRINGAHYTLNKEDDLVDGVKLVDIDRNRKSVTLEVNGEVKKYRLGHGTNTATASVKLKTDSSGVYKARGKINNKPVEYIVDTGATLVSLNSITASELGIDYKSSSRMARSETANGLVSVYLVTLNSVEIGAIKIKNVEAAVHEGEFPRTTLLGMSFLKQVKMEREGSILSLQLN